MTDRSTFMRAWHYQQIQPLIAQADELVAKISALANEPNTSREQTRDRRDDLGKKAHAIWSQATLHATLAAIPDLAVLEGLDTLGLLQPAHDDEPENRHRLHDPKLLDLRDHTQEKAFLDQLNQSGASEVEAPQDPQFMNDFSRPVAVRGDHYLPLVNDPDNLARSAFEVQYYFVHGTRCPDHFWFSSTTPSEKESWDAVVYVVEQVLASQGWKRPIKP